jgi:Gram-negative bacterial TonB protein C-terminal
MTPDPTGRFCSSCTKSVVDFTNKSTEEIQQYFIENSGAKVCGRFKNEQVHKVPIPIPRSVLEQQMPFHKAFLLILFIVMGSTLFSCKNHNDDFVTGEPAVVEDDTIQLRATTGVVRVDKDKNGVSATDSTIVNYRQQPVTVGEVAVEPDTLDKFIPKELYTASEVEELPKYSKGMDGLYSFIKSNFKIPDADKETKGKIFLSFIVEKDGSLSNIKVVRGINEALNSEAIRVLKASEKWIPGQQNGEKVRVSYTIPIQIKPD